MAELKTQFKPVEVIAVNQCSGNSRGLFSPRVTGGQLANGAMGNARWLGVPLKDVLARAELKNSCASGHFRRARYRASIGGGDFVKALDVNHAMDGEVMLAYQMNGTDIPMLNGYPGQVARSRLLRHLLGQASVGHPGHRRGVRGFWMKPATAFPTTTAPASSPGPRRRNAADRPLQRALVHHLGAGRRARSCRQQTVVRGIAFDGGQGIREVAYSTDGGQTWREREAGRTKSAATRSASSPLGLRPTRDPRPARPRLEPLRPEPAHGGAVATGGLHAQCCRGVGHGDCTEGSNMKTKTLIAMAIAASSRWALRAWRCEVHPAADGGVR